jgi:hypothetical protein
LLPKTTVALNSSHTALPTLISKFPPTNSPPNIINNSPRGSPQKTKFKIQLKRSASCFCCVPQLARPITYPSSLPNLLHSLQPTLTEKDEGAQSAKIHSYDFSLPPTCNKCSPSNYSPLSSSPPLVYKVASNYSVEYVKKKKKSSSISPSKCLSPFVKSRRLSTVFRKLPDILISIFNNKKEKRSSGLHCEI